LAGIEDAGFMSFRMLDNGTILMDALNRTEDAELFDLRFLILDQ